MSTTKKNSKATGPGSVKPMAKARRVNKMIVTAAAGEEHGQQHLVRSIGRPVVALSPYELELHTEAADLEGVVRSDWYRDTANERALSLIGQEDLDEIIEMSREQTLRDAKMSQEKRKADKIWKLRKFQQDRWEVAKRQGGGGKMPLAAELAQRIKDSGTEEQKSGAGRKRTVFPTHLDRRTERAPFVQISPVERDLQLCAADLDVRSRADWYRDIANERALKVLGEKRAKSIERRVIKEQTTLEAMSPKEQAAFREEKKRLFRVRNKALRDEAKNAA